MASRFDVVPANRVAQPGAALAAVVAQQPRRTVVGRDQQIEIAVAVVVAVGGAARDDRLLQRGAGATRCTASKRRLPRLRNRCGGCA